MGTPHSHSRPTVDVDSTSAEEGSGPSTAKVAVYLSRPSTVPVTTYLTVLGATTGALGPVMSQVTFHPGSTCVAVPFPITGDTLPGAAPSTAFKTAVSVSTNAVLGANDFATITVREDDGTTGTTPPIPPVGPQGDRPGTGRWRRTVGVRQQA
ncbi:hypothetical protein ACFTY7_16410 [Streptomyces sp. NPDC057062]|uniref:hypothetical protein n=1 Tax=Streptomyces sp. NPDC057062 TaxID=3346011 RepID=UPI00362CBF8C